MGMLLIRSVEVEEVDARGDRWEIRHDGPEEEWRADVTILPRVPNAATFAREVVQGTRFRRPDGQEIVVAYSAAAAEVIGLSFEVYEAQERRHAREIHEARALLREAEKARRSAVDSRYRILCAGFLQRLVWLFTGVRTPTGRVTRRERGKWDRVAGEVVRRLEANEGRGVRDGPL